MPIQHKNTAYTTYKPCLNNIKTMPIQQQKTAYTTSKLCLYNIKHCHLLSAYTTNNFQSIKQTGIYSTFVNP